MQNFYESNKKTILMVAGVGAVSALLASVYTAHVRKGNTTIQPRVNTPNAAVKKLDAPTVVDERRYQALQEKPILNTAMNVDELILSSIPVEYDNTNILTLDTVNRINATAADLAVSELLAATKANRQLRRENKDNLQRYVDLYYENLQKAKEIGEKHQRDVLSQLNVTEDALKNAYARHALNDSSLANALNEKLHSNLLSTKELNAAQLETMLQDEWESLRDASNQHISQFRNLARQSEDAAKIALLNAYDAVFTKHGVEEEDLLAGKINHSDASNLRTLLSTTADEHKRLSGL